MRSIFVISLISIFFIASLAAQENYKSAAGLRLGLPIAASYKTFINEKSAIEAFAGIRSYGFGNFINVSGAYQVHHAIGEVEGLSWYYGGGASIFFWNYDTFFENSNFSTTAFGLQGYIGLDYAFSNTPINLTADWIPTYFIGGSLNINSFGSGFVSLGVRYIISR